jgi:hypothetical protein
MATGKLKQANFDAITDLLIQQGTPPDQRVRETVQELEEAHPVLGEVVRFAARKVTQVGGSLRDVQQLTGYNSPATTQRYIKGDTDAKRKLVSLLRPVSFIAADVQNRSNTCLIVGPRYSRSAQGLDESSYERRNLISITEIVFEGLMENFHHIVFRIGADPYQGDDCPNLGIYFPAAQLSRQQDTDDDFHWERLVYPFDQSPEQPAAFLFLILLKARYCQLAAYLTQGADPHRGQFGEHTLRHQQDGSHMGHRVSLHRDSRAFNPNEW